MDIYKKKYIKYKNKYLNLLYSTALNKKKKLKPFIIYNEESYFRNNILKYIVKLHYNIANTNNLCNKKSFFIKKQCPLDTLLKNFYSIKDNYKLLAKIKFKIVNYLYNNKNKSNYKFNYIIIEFLNYIHNINTINYNYYYNFAKNTRQKYSKDIDRLNYEYIFIVDNTLLNNELINYMYNNTLDIIEAKIHIMKNINRIFYIHIDINKSSETNSLLSSYVINIINFFKNKPKSMYIILFIFLQTYLFDFFVRSTKTNIYVAHLYSYLNFINSYLSTDSMLIENVNVMLDTYYNYFYTDKHIINVVNETTTETLSTHIYCNNIDYIEYFFDENNTYKNMNNIFIITFKIIGIFKNITVRKSQDETNLDSIYTIYTNNIFDQIKLLMSELIIKNNICYLIYCLRCIFFNKDQIYNNMNFFSFMYIFVTLCPIDNNSEPNLKNLIKEIVTNIIFNVKNITIDHLSTVKISISTINSFYNQQFLKPYNSKNTVITSESVNGLTSNPLNSKWWNFLYLN